MIFGLVIFQWQVQGGRPRRPHSIGQNFLNLMQFLGKSGNIVCWRLPLGGSVHPPTGNPGSAPGISHCSCSVLDVDSEFDFWLGSECSLLKEKSANIFLKCHIYVWYCSILLKARSHRDKRRELAGICPKTPEM